MRQVIGLLAMCFLFTGCQFFMKNQPKPSLAGIQQNQSENSEKVWVEAETKKIWVNPHVDENGDMIDGHYKYVVLTPGHWAVKGAKNER